MNSKVDRIKLQEFRLLIESQSLVSVEVVRIVNSQAWEIVVSTKVKSYNLSLEKEKRSRQFSSLENACKYLVKAGCYKFDVDASGYHIAVQPA